MPACDGRTDEHTDGQADGHTTSAYTALHGVARQKLVVVVDERAF